jgi:hypothetical protein
MDDDQIKTVAIGHPTPLAPPAPTSTTAPTPPGALHVQDQLINFRLTWLGTFTGFLAAAMAFAANNSNRSLVIVICFWGAVAAASIFVGTLAANRVLWREAKARPWDQPYPMWMFWAMPGTVLPVVIFLFWICVAIWA